MGSDHHDAHGHGHDAHGHGHDAHGHGGHDAHGHGGHDAHGHGGHDDHHDMPRVPYTGMKGPHTSIPLPQIGTPEHRDNLQAFDNNVIQEAPRSLFDRFGAVMRLEMFIDKDMPKMSGGNVRTNTSLWEWFVQPMVVVRPKDYVDAYIRPNPCPEEFWHLPWKWPRFKAVNPKVPPPVNGKYNDYLHFLAFKNWIDRERDVYVAHTNLVHDAIVRCALREGQYNAAKNCKHFANKSFAMSRMEELNQTLLYMSITGNCAIRETPYPENFLDEKRKIYDDWLARTRMKKPGDAY